MSLLGVQLTLWAGSSVPTPLASDLLLALDTLEVTHSDEGRSGFQMTFRVGRGSADVIDYAALMSAQLKPFARVLMMVTFSAVPQVLMDGIITHQQLTPGNEPGTSSLTLTGEDVSVMMDLEEKAVEHPAQDESVIALKLIASYAQYGLIPTVIPPTALDIPLPIERTPVQQATDLEYLKEMADRYAYVFYVTPGPAPLTNTAYWGPPVRVGLPQKALAVNVGQDTNVNSIQFQYAGLAATTVVGSVQDRSTNEAVPAMTVASTRTPLVSQIALLSQANVRTRLLRGGSGLTYTQALARAQGDTDTASDQVATATGELDALRYGALLQPRGLVDLHGAGYTYDGTWYVKQVTHAIKKGDYRQSFTLSREGVGALLPVVRGG